MLHPHLLSNPINNLKKLQTKFQNLKPALSSREPQKSKLMLQTNTYRGEEPKKTFHSSSKEENFSSKNLKEKIMNKMKIIEHNEKLIETAKIEKKLKNQKREAYKSPIFRCEQKIDPCRLNILKRFRNEQAKQNHNLIEQMPEKKIYLENQKRIECKTSNSNRKEKDKEFFVFDEEKICNSKIRLNRSPVEVSDRFISKIVSKERNRESNQKIKDGLITNSNRKERQTEFFIFDEEKICNSNKNKLSGSPFTISDRFAAKNVSKEKNLEKKTDSRIEISNLSSSRKEMKRKKDRLNVLFNSKESKFSNIPIKRFNIEETDNESTINLSQSLAVIEKQKNMNSKSWIMSKLILILDYFYEKKRKISRI